MTSADLEIVKNEYREWKRRQWLRKGRCCWTRPILLQFHGCYINSEWKTQVRFILENFTAQFYRHSKFFPSKFDTFADIFLPPTVKNILIYIFWFEIKGKLDRGLDVRDFLWAGSTSNKVNICVAFWHYWNDPIKLLVLDVIMRSVTVKVFYLSS